MAGEPIRQSLPQGEETKLRDLLKQLRDEVMMGTHRKARNLVRDKVDPALSTPSSPEVCPACGQVGAPLVHLRWCYAPWRGLPFAPDHVLVPREVLEGISAFRGTTFSEGLLEDLLDLVDEALARGVSAAPQPPSPGQGECECFGDLGLHASTYGGPNGERLCDLCGKPVAPPSSGEAEAVAREGLRQEIINTPETADFMAGVPLEAAHQRERWGSDHDAGKTPWDWFWLIGYLAQKAASAAVAGDEEKAKHHTISTGAALANWHAALAGADRRMVTGAPLDVREQADSLSLKADGGDHG